MKFYTDKLVTEQVSPPSTLQNDGTANRRLFIAETVAMYQSGQFDIGSIRKENANIDIGVMMIPHPEGKETAAIIGGWSFIIPKDAQEPRGHEEVRRVPRHSRTTWASSPTRSRRASRRWSSSASRIRSSPTSRRCCRIGRRVPPHKNWIPITQAYFDGVQRILVGDQEPQEAMDQAAEEIQALLDQ